MAKKNGTEEVEVQSAPTDNWVKLGTRLPTWKPDRGAGTPVRGHLMGVKRAPDIDGKPQVIYIVRLTAKAKVHEADDKIRMADPGEEVAIFGNAVLNRELFALSRNTHYVFEVMIIPQGQEKTKNGFKVNRFEIRQNPVPAKRPQAYAALAMSDVSLALPAHERTEEGEAVATEIPF
jgi:hypothetical protein